MLTMVLYYRNEAHREMPRPLPVILSILRFLAFFLVGLLLLGPLLRHSRTEIRKPIVLIARDNSESVRAAGDSVSLRRWDAALGEVAGELSGDYEVHSWTFGADVSDTSAWDQHEKATNIASVFEQAYDRYGAENLAAIVLASDGIYNEGANPFYALQPLKLPVYSVLLGDTTQRKDLKIRKIFHNKIAYLGDRFSVQVDISAFNCADTDSKLSVHRVRGGQAHLVEQVPFRIDQADYFRTIELSIDAAEPGVQRYRFSLSPVSGESTTSNNTREIFVDVLDARQKVLILAASPHPDIAALRQILEHNRNYQVEHALYKDFKKKITDYDLLVLHQLPTRNADVAPLVSNARSAGLPILFIVGNQTDLAAFNNVQDALQARGGNAGANDVTADINPVFRLFSIEEKTRAQITAFVPLSSPYAEYSAGPGAEVLLRQRIGKIGTEYPLLLFQSTSGQKTGVLAAEGIWRWKLYDYLQTESFDHISELVRKTFTYLSVKEDKRRFRVFQPKNIFDENEPLIFGAELYNESYEQVNEPDVQIRLTNSSGKDFNFVFNRRGTAYYLEPGLFPVDQYRYTATVSYGGRELKAEGQFTVQPIEKELYDLTADHGLLRRIAAEYDGRALAPDEISQLPDWIRSNEKIRTLLYETSSTEPAIHLKWFFFVLLILLGAEWFLRKYWGSY